MRLALAGMASFSGIVIAEPAHAQVAPACTNAAPNGATVIADCVNSTPIIGTDGSATYYIVRTATITNTASGSITMSATANGNGSATINVNANNAAFRWTMPARSGIPVRATPTETLLKFRAQALHWS